MGRLYIKNSPSVRCLLTVEKTSKTIAILALNRPDPHKYDLTSKLQPAFSAISLDVLSEKTSICRYCGFSSHPRPKIEYHICDKKSRIFYPYQKQYFRPMKNFIISSSC